MHRLPAQGVRTRLSSETGVTLIETLISAVILVIVIGAVLTTIDASGRTTSVNKNRSVAAALAEQDQERMRAMSPTALDGHAKTQNVDIDGVNYTVESESEWMHDATGTTESCENASGSQANYMRISSTVTSNVVGTRVKPVVMRSIVAPRVESFPEDSGTLTVKVTDEHNQPVAGMLVSISPAAKPPRATNDFGCAVFSHIPVGAYKAILDTVGWVNEQNKQRYELDTNVQLDKTTSVGMTYAPAAYITSNFKTGALPGTSPSSAHSVTVSNAKTGDLVFNAPTSVAVPTLTVGPLFPYTDGYTAYAGRCAKNDPADPAYSPANDAYVATQPGFTSVTRNQTSVVDVLQPSVNLRVVNSINVGQVGARVVFTPQTSCGSTSSSAKFVRLTGTNGALLEPWLPFGTYTACADFPSGTRWLKRDLVTVDNTSPNGTTAPATIQLPPTTSTSVSPCAS
jgi:Tfp pilus assembly protein PilV